MKIKIKKLYGAFSRDWNILEEMCGICQQGFNQICSDCKHPTECPPVKGQCDHAFHLHCIEQWVKGREECPMCRLRWNNVKQYSHKQ